MLISLEIYIIIFKLGLHICKSQEIKWCLSYQQKGIQKPKPGLKKEPEQNPTC